MKYKWIISGLIIGLLLTLTPFVLPSSPLPPSISTISSGQVVKTIAHKLFSSPAVLAAADYTCDGSADDVQFQAAMNALPASGGKIIALAGTYVFAATVSRAIDNVSVEGVGRGTYFTYDASHAIFSAGAQAGWTFKDFRTDAGSVTLASATSYGVINCWLGTAYYASYGSGTGLVGGVTLSGNNITLSGTVDGVDVSTHAAGTAVAQHTAGVGQHTHGAATDAAGGTLTSPYVNEAVAMSVTSTNLNLVDDNDFVDTVTSRENWHPLHLGSINLSTATTVNSGSCDFGLASLGFLSGATANSSYIRTYSPMLFASNSDGQYRWNWDKSFTLAFVIRVSPANTQGVGYIQIKGAETLGAAGTYAIGLKLANLSLYGESYGSGGLSTLNLSTALTEAVPAEIKIVYTAGSDIKWYVNGTLKGTQSTANLIPSGNSATNTFLCFSAQNGAAAAAYTYWVGLLRWGVAK